MAKRVVERRQDWKWEKANIGKKMKKKKWASNGKKWKAKPIWYNYEKDKTHGKRVMANLFKVAKGYTSKSEILMNIQPTKSMSLVR